MRAVHVDEREQRYRIFAIAFLVYTLAVILWGAYVRASLSGDGCGDHWPLCHGRVLPVDPSTKTLVELTHRITSGLCWLFALWGFVWARRVYPAAHGVRKAAGATLFFMTTEALVGAGLVLLSYVAESEAIARAYWMGAHLINTFALIMSMTLVVVFSFGHRPPRPSERGGVGRMPGLFLASFVAVFAIGVTGAIAALGDTVAPASSLAEGLAQDLSPSAHLFVRLRSLHPVVALGGSALLLFTAGAAITRSEGRLARRSAIALAAVVVLQVALGFLNLLLLAPVFMQLVHLLVADALLMILTAHVVFALEPADISSTHLEPGEVEPARA